MWKTSGSSFHHSPSARSSRGRCRGICTAHQRWVSGSAAIGSVPAADPCPTDPRDADDPLWDGSDCVWSDSGDFLGGATRDWGLAPLGPGGDPMAEADPALPPAEEPCAS